MSHRFVLRPQTTAAHSSPCKHKDVPKDGRRLPFGCPVSKQKTRSPWRTRATGNWILYSQNKMQFFYFAILQTACRKSPNGPFRQAEARRGSAGLCCGAGGGRGQRSGSHLGEEGSFFAGCAAAGEGMRSDAVRYLFRGLYATAKTRRVIAMLGSMYARLYSRE